MINVITSHGSSFKGLSAYLLADVDRQGDERVAWTETCGLATDDPVRATKIMIATAMSQADLKDRAGVANTGRKSHKHVMHYVLSWHPDERETLTKDEMLAAARASMTYLGNYEGEKLGEGLTREGRKKKKAGERVTKADKFDIIAPRTQHADEHQALIVCHDDGPGTAKHLHIMLNRVHPEHGVMLPDSKDYEKLSAWALDYRRSQGNEHLCPKRSQNAEKRVLGILANDPRKPRNIYEQEQAIAEADPGSRKKALLEQQAKRAKALKSRTEAMKQSQAEAMHKLEERHQAAERAERDKAGEEIKAAVSAVRAKYAPKIDQLTERQADEVAAFKEAKGTAAGHVGNLWKAFKTRQWMTEIRTDPIHAMKHSFALAFDSGMQLKDIQNHHARERGELRGKRTGEERDAARGIRTDLGFKLDELRQSYHEQRNDLILVQGMDQAKNKAEWDQLKKDRLAIELDEGRSPDARQEAANDNERGDEERGEGSGGGKQPKPSPRVSEQVQAAAPAPSPYDIPIDELRQAARELKEETVQPSIDDMIDRAGHAAGLQEPDPDKDMGR